MVIETFGTVMQVMNVAEKATKLYDWFSGVHAGDELKRMTKDLERAKVEIKRLSDHVLYAPALHQAVNLQGGHATADLRATAAALEPVASGVGGDILSSALVATPERLRQAFIKDPWEVLVDVRPLARAKRPSNPDLMPISFSVSARPCHVLAASPLHEAPRHSRAPRYSHLASNTQAPA
jgi:hypothetical protein